MEREKKEFCVKIINKRFGMLFEKGNFLPHIAVCVFSFLLLLFYCCVIEPLLGCYYCVTSVVFPPSINRLLAHLNNKHTQQIDIDDNLTQTTTIHKKSEGKTRKLHTHKQKNKL